MRLPRVSISQRPSLTPSDIQNINKNSSRKSSAVREWFLFIFLQFYLKQQHPKIPQASIQLRISSIGTPIQQNTTCNNNSASPHTHCHLQPSESQSSLTRSQSLILRSSIRHAPDCKSHPDNVGCSSDSANTSNHNKNGENDEMVQNNNNTIIIDSVNAVNDKKWGETYTHTHTQKLMLMIKLFFFYFFIFISWRV